jgi:hypothetical protein
MHLVIGSNQVPPSECARNKLTAGTLVPFLQDIAELDGTDSQSLEIKVVP